MLRFLSGFMAAIVIVVFAGFLWLRLGFMDARADAPENALERAVAMPALDASVRRHASQVQNPVVATDANLVAGMKVYQNNCAWAVMGISISHTQRLGTHSPRGHPNSWKTPPTCRSIKISTSSSTEYG